MLSYSQNSPNAQVTLCWVHIALLTALAPFFSPQLLPAHKCSVCPDMKFLKLSYLLGFTGLPYHPDRQLNGVVGLPF